MLSLTWNYMLSAIEISIIIAIMILSITKILAVYMQNTPSPFPRREDITHHSSAAQLRPIKSPDRKPFPHDYALRGSRNVETFFQTIEKRTSR